MVPLAPGTGGDVVARLSLNALAQTLGQSIVIENKGGAGGTIGAGPGGEGRARRLHAAVSLLDACDRGVALHQPALRHRERLRRGRAGRQRAERAGGLAVEGLQGPEGLCREGQGQSRRLHLCIGGRRRDDAPDGGALPPQRGLQRGACAVPRRRLPAGDHGRPRRLRLLADRDLAAEHQGRPPAGARGVEPEARHGAAGPADHARDGLRRFRLRDLVRHLPAGEDAARDRRQARGGDSQDAWSSRRCASVSRGSTSRRCR